MKKSKTENLKPFPPGVSGNPKGRPKKLPGLDELLAECLGTGGSEAKAIIQALIKKAKKGDVRAAEAVLDRAFGKSRQRIDLDVSGALGVHPTGFDYTKLSDADLEKVTQIVSKYCDP